MQIHVDFITEIRDREFLGVDGKQIFLSFYFILARFTLCSEILKYLLCLLFRHQLECDVTLFCEYSEVRCTPVLSQSIVGYFKYLYKNVGSGDLRSQFGCLTTVTKEQTARLNCNKPIIVCAELVPVH